MGKKEKEREKGTMRVRVLLSIFLEHKSILAGVGR